MLICLYNHIQFRVSITTKHMTTTISCISYLVFCSLALALVSTTTASTGDATAASQNLSMHNAVRRAVGMPPLLWNTTLATYTSTSGPALGGRAGWPLCLSKNQSNFSGVVILVLQCFSIALVRHPSSNRVAFNQNQS